MSVGIDNAATLFVIRELRRQRDDARAEVERLTRELANERSTTATVMRSVAHSHAAEVHNMEGLLREERGAAARLTMLHTAARGWARAWRAKAKAQTAVARTLREQLLARTRQPSKPPTLLTAWCEPSDRNGRTEDVLWVVWLYRSGEHRRIGYLWREMPMPVRSMFKVCAAAHGELVRALRAAKLNPNGGDQ